MVRSSAVTGYGGGGGGDGGFAPSQYVASAIRKEREGKRGEGGKMAAEIKFLRSLEKMPIAAHLLRSTKDRADMVSPLKRLSQPRIVNSVRSVLCAACTFPKKEK